MSLFFLRWYITRCSYGLVIKVVTVLILLMTDCSPRDSAPQLYEFEYRSSSAGIQSWCFCIQDYRDVTEVKCIVGNTVLESFDQFSIFPYVTRKHHNDKLEYMVELPNSAINNHALQFHDVLFQVYAKSPVRFCVQCEHNTEMSGQYPFVQNLIYEVVGQTGTLRVPKRMKDLIFLVPDQVQLQVKSPFYTHSFSSSSMRIQFTDIDLEDQTCLSKIKSRGREYYDIEWHMSPEDEQKRAVIKVITEQYNVFRVREGLGGCLYTYEPKIIALV